MSQLEKQQEFIKGALSGLLAGIIMFGFVETFRWLGLTKYGISYLAGDTVFAYQNNLALNSIAFLIHSGVGVFWGIIIAFLFTRVFSPDHYLIKILFISYCIFFFHLGLLDEPFHYNREIHKQTFDLLVILAGYLLYGLSVAIALKKQQIISTR